MLFQPVRRPSGFTQSAMRYPPRSPDITINTQTKTIGQQNRDLTLWRFGFRVRYKVRDHVGQGYGHVSQCFSKM